MTQYVESISDEYASKPKRAMPNADHYFVNRMIFLFEKKSSGFKFKIMKKEK